MNQKYVTSLELSKQLKEAGIPQESEYEWCFVPAGVAVLSKEWLHKKDEPYHMAPAGMKTYSAFHVGELADLLPVRHDITIGIQKGSKIYHVNYWWGTPNPLRGEGITDYWRTHNEIMVEAMGEMLLYLVKNKIYDPTTTKENQPNTHMESRD